MSWRWPALLLTLGLGACVFAPDLSRFSACDGEGGCPAGFACLAQEGLCLPDCGARGPCPPEESESDAGPPGTGLPDAGPPDTGMADAGLPDAGMADAGLPDAGSPDAGMADAGSPALRLAGPGILVDFVSGQSYAEQLSAVGGQPPYRFELVQSNSLPAGLVLGGTGSVEGSTSGPGTSFEVRVTDASQPPQSHVRILHITQLTGTQCMLGDLCLRTRELPDGRVGQAYTYLLRATPRSSAPTWKLESGRLPEGLELIRETGQLTGTPSQAGTFTFSITATELISTTAPREFSLKIIF